MKKIKPLILILLFLFSETVIPQQLIEPMFVIAKSGLNYRDKPNGKILGKLSYGEKVFVIEKTGIIEEIKDNGELITGEWVGIKNKFKKKHYVFSAYLIGKIDEIEVGVEEKYEKSKQLSFQQITEKEYLSVSSEAYLNEAKLEEDKDFFYIATPTKKVKFKHYRDYGGKESWSGFNCKGYYPKLKLYAITESFSSSNLGFGRFYLFDNVNNYYYKINSIGDGEVASPIPSINNKFWVYFYNDIYDESPSEIRVLKVNDNYKPLNYLGEYASGKSNFSVEKIKWKNDYVFFIKSYRKKYVNEKWVKEYSYSKASLKK